MGAEFILQCNFGMINVLVETVTDISKTLNEIHWLKSILRIIKKITGVLLLFLETVKNTDQGQVVALRCIYFPISLRVLSLVGKKTPCTSSRRERKCTPSISDMSACAFLATWVQLSGVWQPSLVSSRIVGKGCKQAAPGLLVLLEDYFSLNFSYDSFLTNQHFLAEIHYVICGS